MVIGTRDFPDWIPKLFSISNNENENDESTTQNKNGASNYSNLSTCVISICAILTLILSLGRTINLWQ